MSLLKRFTTLRNRHFPLHQPRQISLASLPLSLLNAKHKLPVSKMNIVQQQKLKYLRNIVY